MSPKMISKSVMVLLVLLFVFVMTSDGWAQTSGFFAKPIRLEADGKFINVDVGHAAPFVYDFDNDSKRDLLVGQFGQGRLRIYRNIGGDLKPRYDKEQWFKAGGDFGQIPSG
ncbi:MAG: hypothetical protein GY869_07400 [Planctomycetes bacterium]|nr:hypothetical protein [Planctomycetota bacterium]